MYDKKVINLDFHTAPHFGDDSVLEKHWAGVRNKTMKGALTLFAQDAASKLILCASPYAPLPQGMKSRLLGMGDDSKTNSKFISSMREQDF